MELTCGGSSQAFTLPSSKYLSTLLALGIEYAPLVEVVKNLTDRCVLERYMTKLMPKVARSEPWIDLRYHVLSECSSIKYRVQIVNNYSDHVT